MQLILSAGSFLVIGLWCLKAVQTATIMFALPFTIVIVLMAVSLWRGVPEDWRQEKKLLRRRLHESASKQSEWER